MAGALAVTGWGLAPAVVRRVGAQPALPADLFTLGVASGYPLPTGVVLWTRLAPAPLVPGGGMPREVVAVEWEVARDERMSQVVQRGTRRRRARVGARRPRRGRRPRAGALVLVPLPRRRRR